MTDFVKKYGQVAAVLGGQWGDEGKGKLIDILAREYDVVVRSTGGANAGHTVYIPDNNGSKQKFVFHLMPSGVLYPHVNGIIGNGCVVHVPTFFEEVEALQKNNIDVGGRVFISDRAHLVFEYHKLIDTIQEQRKGKNKVGTTGRGIGPAYADKISRSGIRMHELLNFSAFEVRLRAHIESLQIMYDFEFDIDAELERYHKLLPRLMPYITDTAFFIQKALAEGKKILLEGANGTLLDIDHGTYPYVTSSNASIGGLIAGCGINPARITSVLGIMKAYFTRVGAGPFPTELHDATGEKLRTIGGEFGSTTGRPRRCGWFDAVASRYGVLLNGLTGINLTKLDVLDEFETINIATAYIYQGKELQSFPASADILSQVEVKYIEMPGWKQNISHVRRFSDLPENAKRYIATLEQLLQCPIEVVGVGTGRDEIALP